MNLEVRAVGPDEHLEFLKTLSTPFAFDVEPDEEEDDVARFRILFEGERSRCAFDDGVMVGTLGCFSLPMTVPGGSVACGGTTMVSVQPTHRRRGVLRSMMSAHLDDVRQRGEPMAALFASDSAIYGRFGYGIAGLAASAKIDRRHVDRHRLAAAPAPVRSVGSDEILALARPVFDAVVPERPGMYARSDGWWQRRLRDRPSDRRGATAFRYAVAEEDGAVTGYVQYRIKAGSWDEGHGDNVVMVREIFALTPGAVAGLWALVLEHDLTSRIEVHGRPVDDPLFDLLGGYRRVAPRLGDGLFVRLVDIPAALQARRYGVDGRLVLGVHDAWSGESQVLALEVEDGSATCRPTGSEPAVSVDVEDLGAVYLGWSRLRTLARSGRVGGGATDLARADRMLAWDPAPWCQEVF